LKVIYVLALCLLPSVTLSQQRPAYVVNFNGHFLSVSLSTLDAVANFEPADIKAAQICETVGKTAELQNRQKVSPNRFILNYVCI
jgi:hypothetical protein